MVVLSEQFRRSRHQATGLTMCDAVGTSPAGGGEIWT
jgi:hypothetical protein